MAKNSKTKHLVDRNLRLHDIRLVNGAFGLQLLLDPAGNLRMPSEIAFNANVQSRREADQKKFGYLISLTMSGGYGQEAPGHEGVKIVATYAAAYEVDSLDGFSDQEIQEFGQDGCVFHIWPYWREYVHSTMGRMGLPALLMPIVKYGQFKFNQQLQQNAPVNQPVPAQTDSSPRPDSSPPRPSKQKSKKRKH